MGSILLFGPGLALPLFHAPLNVHVGYLRVEAGQLLLHSRGVFSEHRSADCESPRLALALHLAQRLLELLYRFDSLHVSELFPHLLYLPLLLCRNALGFLQLFLQRAHSLIALKHLALRRDELQRRLRGQFRDVVS